MCIKTGITGHLRACCFCVSRTGIFALQAEGDMAGKRMCASGLPICGPISVAGVLEGSACLSGDAMRCGVQQGVLRESEARARGDKRRGDVCGSLNEHPWSDGRA